jgi:hypothetical protein
MVTTNVRASALADGSEAFMHYMIDVQSLKVGGYELLQFKDKSIAIQAILDSGTSCLVVPDDTFGGGLLASPFKTFQKHFGDLDEPTIHITIEGQTFSLPYDDYMVDDKPCVMKMKSTPRTFLLGDVVFRRMVVVHNLNNPLQPQITLGQRDPNYKLTTVVKKVGYRSHVPLGKKAVQRPMPETEHAVPANQARQGMRVRVGDNVAGAQAAIAASTSPEGQYQAALPTQQAAAYAPMQQQPMIGQQAQYPPAYPQQQQQSYGYQPVPQYPMQAPPQYQQQPLVQQQPMVPAYQMNQPHFAPQYQVASSTGEVYPTVGAGGVGGAAAQQQAGVQAEPALHNPSVGMVQSSEEPGEAGVGAAPQQQQAAAAQTGGAQEEPPLHNPSAGARRRLLSSTTEVQRIPMTTSNSYIYYASLEVGSPRQKNIHVILDTGSSVFAIFAVPHGGPSVLVICLLVAACILGATSIGLLALSWYQGTYEEMDAAGMDPLLGGDGESRG